MYIVIELVIIEFCVDVLSVG